METTYPFADIEDKWQRVWESARLFHSDPVENRPNCVVIELPPFANGSLHLGHVRNYVMGDVYARFRRMAGFNVLYTSGFDSFGLPNELTALERGRHPKEIAEEVMAEMRRDFVRLGLSHDTRRIIGNHDEGFYGWVQYVFVKLFEQGLAYRQRYPVLWCPTCSTTLADSLTTEGRCWRCRSLVETRSLEQWLVRENVFADSMLAALDDLKRWPLSIKRIHADWIGRREGADVTLRVVGVPEEKMTAFVADVTRLPSVTAVKVAPDHPAISRLTAAGMVTEMVTTELAQMHREQALEQTAKVPLGVAVKHPLTGVELPVLVSRQLDLRSYGGVELVFGESPDLEMPVSDVLEALETAQTGCATVRYRLRDWNIARQRYWGPPVPIIYCTDCGAVPVPVLDLPVLLPLDIDLNSHCNPLDQHPTFARTICPLCGAAARRDTDTLETYCSPWWYHWNAKRMSTADPFSQSEARLYMPVDVMIGGNDQARTCFFHLRMMARALKQAGVVELEEPIDTLIAIAMVKAEGRKMSKSEGNVIDPKDIIARHGADALRLAMMGAAAPDRDFSWSSDLVRRSYAFLTKVHRFSIRSADKLRLDTTGPSVVVDTNYSLSKKLAISVEKAVERTTLSMVQNMFHLAVSNLELLFAKIEGYESEALRRRSELDERDRGALAVSFGTFLKMLTPICPHIAEECWVLLHGSGLIAEAMWPIAFPDRFRKPAIPYTARP